MVNAKKRAAESRRPRSPGWECSTCGELINRVEDGWVEWLACEEQGVPFTKGLRLVHRGKKGVRNPCQYDARQEFQRNRNIVEGLPLERFVGPDGLMLLLSLIASGDLPGTEIIELAKRVQVPGYELARAELQIAIEDGLLMPAIGNGFYLQSEIQALLHWAASAA
jgi:hypothetical protein